MGKLPDRWLDYTRIGKPLRDLPIIAFKTPLDKKFHRPNKKAHGVFVEKEEQFTPWQLFESLREDGHFLDVVIDLTFTFRYYSGQKELQENLGIRYEKVKCPGKIIPDRMIMQRVADIFNEVIYLNTVNEKDQRLAGIHCTHGLNRTGYIVCRYLIEWHNYSPDDAIRMFNEARGHDMERENYIEDLMTRIPGKLYEDWLNNRKSCSRENDRSYRMSFIDNFNSKQACRNSSVEDNDNCKERNYDQKMNHSKKRRKKCRKRKDDKSYSHQNGDYYHDNYYSNNYENQRDGRYYNNRRNHYNQCSKRRYHDERNYYENKRFYEDRTLHEYEASEYDYSFNRRRRR